MRSCVLCVLQRTDKDVEVEQDRYPVREPSEARRYSEWRRAAGHPRAVEGGGRIVEGETDRALCVVRRLVWFPVSPVVGQCAFVKGESVNPRWILASSHWRQQSLSTLHWPSFSPLAVAGPSRRGELPVHGANPFASSGEEPYCEMSVIKPQSRGSGLPALGLTSATAWIFCS